jgi:hypothetical protein
MRGAEQPEPGQYLANVLQLAGVTNRFLINDYLRYKGILEPEKHLEPEQFEINPGYMNENMGQVLRQLQTMQFEPETFTHGYEVLTRAENNPFSAIAQVSAKTLDRLFKLLDSYLQGSQAFEPIKSILPDEDSSA